MGPMPMMVLALIGLVGIAPANALALAGRTIVKDKCVSCHNITGPPPHTFEGILKRKGPDLFYAGSKFQRKWLLRWIQKPSIIRPSGAMYLNNIVTRKGKDRIGKGTVKPCPSKLGRAEAEAVTDFLMTLKDSTMPTGIIDPAKRFRKSKALMTFSSRYPCIGCHIIRFKGKIRGGKSGPDLRRAGTRLNPDWVYARIKNPQYWDPKTWMPKIEMSHKKRILLTRLIGSMKARR